MGKCSCGGSGVCPHCGKSTKSDSYRPLSSFSDKDIRRWANSSSPSPSSGGARSFFAGLFGVLAFVLIASGVYLYEQDRWSCESGEEIEGNLVLDGNEDCADGSDEVINSETNQTKSYYEEESTWWKNGVRDIVLQTCGLGFLFAILASRLVD